MIFFIPSVCFAKSLKVNKIAYEVSDYLELDGLYYDAINNNLTLTNANYESIKSDYDLNITLIGENKLNANNFSFCISAKNVMINGTGILELNSIMNGILANSLVVKDAIIYGNTENKLVNILENNSKSINNIFLGLAITILN